MDWGHRVDISSEASNSPTARINTHVAAHHRRRILDQAVRATLRQPLGRYEGVLIQVAGRDVQFSPSAIRAEFARLWALEHPRG